MRRVGLFDSPKLHDGFNASWLRGAIAAGGVMPAGLITRRGQKAASSLAAVPN